MEWMISSFFWFSLALFAKCRLQAVCTAKDFHPLESISNQQENLYFEAFKDIKLGVGSNMQ